MTKIESHHKKNTEDQNPFEGIKRFCVCYKCKKHIPYVEGGPCSGRRCPDCGTPMISRKIHYSVSGSHMVIF